MSREEMLERRVWLAPDKKRGKTITITLKFDHADTTREEIKLHLKDLIEADVITYKEEIHG